VTISVTPHPETSPPSCTVTVSVPTGNVMSAVAVYRNDHNGRTLLRTQPTAGFDSRTVTDIECPYEENVTYDWTATYSDPASASTVFNETWASIAAWTAAGFGTYNVSGGKLRNNGTSPSYLYRTVASAKYRITVASFDGGTVNSYIFFGGNTAGVGYGVFVRVTETGTLYFGDSITSALVATTIDPTAPFVIDFNATTVSISGTGGSASLPLARTITAVTIYSTGNSANSVNVGAIKVESYAASSNIAQTSSPVSLDPDEAWLIHPGSASLSVPLAETDATVAGIVDIAPVENPSNATVHKILGSATPIPTTTGPRTDDRTTMTVATVTSAEAASLRALLAPDVPLLVQIPPSWGLDFNSGFYQVGDTDAARVGQVVSGHRIWTLPMQKVQSPVVDVENTGWSYASVAAEFDTYLELVDNFATYADLASNTRS
jgi:hypothetical protein